VLGCLVSFACRGSEAWTWDAPKTLAIASWEIRLCKDMIVLHHERRKATLPELILSSPRKIALPDISSMYKFLFDRYPYNPNHTTKPTALKTTLLQRKQLTSNHPPHNININPQLLQPRNRLLNPSIPIPIYPLAPPTTSPLCLPRQTFSYFINKSDVFFQRVDVSDQLRAGFQHRGAQGVEVGEGRGV
jgi:hypothetical protein